MRIKDEQQSGELEGSGSSFSSSKRKGGEGRRRGSFRDRHDAGTRRNNARHPRLPRAAGARKNDSMAPRVRIPTRHELPNDASLLSAPLPSLRVASRRDVTRRGDDTSRERGRIVNPALFHRYREVKSRVHRNTRHGMRSLEAFWIAWKARIPVVNRYCERTVYGLLCVYNAYWCERISRVRSFVRINIRFERRECWNKWMKIRY